MSYTIVVDIAAYVFMLYAQPFFSFSFFRNNTLDLITTKYNIYVDF